MALGRLKHRAEFLRLAATGARWATPGLVLQIAPRPPASDGETPGSVPGEVEEIRVGFTCSRKVGNAVARNRARRRLRAAAAQLLPSGAKPGHDYVLIGRRETLERPYAQLLADLEQAMRRAKPRSDHPRKESR